MWRGEFTTAVPPADPHATRPCGWAEERGESGYIDVWVWDREGDQVRVGTVPPGGDLAAWLADRGLKRTGIRIDTTYRLPATGGDPRV